MRVLHIVSHISVRSGIMSVVMSYYRKLYNENIVFDFLYFNEQEDNYKSEISNMGGQCFLTPNPTSVFSFNRFIKSFCNDKIGQYDIIHLHDPFLVLFYFKLKRMLGAKVFISHAHNTKFSDKRIGEWRNRLFSMPNYWLPDYYFACSKMAGKTIFGLKFKDGTVINNAINVSKFQNTPDKRSAMRRSLGIDDCFVIGHIGNFIEQKNQSFIVDIFFEIQKNRTDALLMFVGDGPNKRMIKEKCITLGIENKVKFLGVRNDVAEVVSAFDRFLFPSLYEGLGIVLIEAQTAGVPCIYSSVVPSETNILKENNKILDLSQSAKEWADAVLNENLCIQYNSSEKITDNGFNIDVEALKVGELYKNLMENKA